MDVRFMQGRTDEERANDVPDADGRVILKNWEAYREAERLQGEDVDYLLTLTIDTDYYEAGDGLLLSEAWPIIDSYGNADNAVVVIDAKNPTETVPMEVWD